MIPRPQLPAAPPRPPRPIDPNAPAAVEGALFGFPWPLEEARLVAIPVPYEATVSSRGGTREGPRALLDASGQVDLCDPLAGEPWRLGIAALPVEETIIDLSEAACAAAERARDGDREAHAEVERIGFAVGEWVRDVTAATLASGRVPLLFGGEHAISYGAIEAAAARWRGLGVLQIDAHADLRAAYEGWRTSHASVMRRVLELSGVARLVQVGLRDLSSEELQAREASQGRAVWFTDAELARRGFEGEPFAALVRDVIATLPEEVWVSFDIDGLDASLCPRTGTPVPGGLSWREATYLLAEIARSGRRVVGADLVEIGAGFWDGYVAAKLLYLLAGVAGGTVPGRPL
ncbi:MAG: agmatinase family protein [Acidobacteria bacterium]|jgi:agmatinase|nr:agmatinase family protein [Acidobacteriota bacterium]